MFAQFYNKRSVLRRQSRDANRNIKRSVYCRGTDNVSSNEWPIGLRETGFPVHLTGGPTWLRSATAEIKQ